MYSIDELNRINQLNSITSRHLLKVILGSHTVTSDHTGIERKLIEIIKHPNFNPSLSNANDIAILKLETSVIFNRMVRPLCLPSPHQSFVGQNGIVIGWGSTSILGKKIYFVLYYITSL